MWIGRCCCWDQSPPLIHRSTFHCVCLCRFHHCLHVTSGRLIHRSISHCACLGLFHRRLHVCAKCCAKFCYVYFIRKQTKQMSNSLAKEVIHGKTNDKTHSFVTFISSFCDRLRKGQQCKIEYIKFLYLHPHLRPPSLHHPNPHPRPPRALMKVCVTM